MHDVVIVGGALVGSSTAWHLLNREPGLKVAIIEKDPAYEFAASARSNAMVRLVFSQPENLLMSRYGQEFYSEFPERMRIGDERPVLDYHRGGLLVIGNDAHQAEDIAINAALQQRLGSSADVLTAGQVAARWPALNANDIVNAVHSADAGWIDPHGALTGLRRKARDLGAEYLRGKVSGFDVSGSRIRSVILEDGQRIPCAWAVNAAGAWAGEVCRLSGFTIPVAPLPRAVFYFETRAQVEGLPYVRDGLGLGFRPEGRGFISGVTDPDLAGDFCFDVNYDWFEERVWPALANRVPAFESIRLMNAWVGHYAQCLFDGNMIIGAWPGEPENFLIATGFSGHGLQHAPAVGRALSELILDRSFTTIDLSRLTARRILENAPYAERGWKA